MTPASGSAPELRRRRFDHRSDETQARLTIVRQQQRAVEIDEAGAVKVEMTLTAPGCPSAQELPVQVRDALLAVPGVTAAEVETVWDPPWDPSRMSEEARLALNMF